MSYGTWINTQKLTANFTCNLSLDYNECLNASDNNCDRNANCTNTVGSFICKCKNGWVGNGIICTSKKFCFRRRIFVFSFTFSLSYDDCTNREISMMEEMLSFEENKVVKLPHTPCSPQSVWGTNPLAPAIVNCFL